MTAAHQHINQSSNNVEFYTPGKIVDLAREVLGGAIDLDPASCEIANQTVKAKRFFTKQDDGLSKEWFGRVWMNHPFGKGELKCPAICKKKTCKSRGYCIGADTPSNWDWTFKLVNEFYSGRVEAALCITFSSMSEKWMFPLLEFPQCFPYGRIHYRKPDGTTQSGATKGSVITYLGKDTDRFIAVFSQIGIVKV